MDQKEEVDFLNRQHPSQWVNGNWYPAKSKQGREVEIRRSKAVRNGRSYLHIRYPIDVILKDHEGNEVSRRKSFRHFRANIETGAIKEINDW
jgi:hypothetical protein